MNSETNRRKLMDPEDTNAAIRSDLEERRVHGEAFLFGRCWKGQVVYVEGVKYHWTGTVVSVLFGGLVLEKAQKIINNDDASITARGEFKDIVLPVATIVAIAPAKAVSFMPRK